MNQVNWYQKNGILYNESHTEDAITKSHQALQFACSVLKGNSDVFSTLKNETKKGEKSPLAWLDAESYSSSGPSFEFNCCIISCCPSRSCSGSGGKCDGDSVKAIGFVLLISALFIAFLASLGFTVYHAGEADIERQKMEAVDECKKGVDANIDICNKTNAVIRIDYNDKVTKTALTAALTAGVAILTATAVIALYAHLSATPMPIYAKQLAMAGGSIAGGAILFHLLRYTAKDGKDQKWKSETHKRKYQDLQQAIFNLADSLPSPYKLLDSVQGAAYVKIKDTIYWKNETGACGQETCQNISKDFQEVLVKTRC